MFLSANGIYGKELAITMTQAVYKLDKDKDKDR